MDIATIGGMVFTMGAVLISIMLNGGPPAIIAFLNAPSAFVVIGCGTAATIAAYKINDLAGIIKAMSLTFKTKADAKENTIRMLVDLSNKARREGLLALEAEQDKITDDFMKQSLQLVVDGVEPETIRVSMELELGNLENRHFKWQGMFKQLASQYPAWGMVGTLVGLINMLKNLSDPSSIGPAMSVALITTFYGSIMANLLCNPVAEKLNGMSKEEIQLKEMIIEGILSIQAGENPRIMEHKLKTFLSPTQKTRYNEYQGGSVGGVASQEG